MTLISKIETPACGCESGTGLVSIDQALSLITSAAGVIHDVERLPLAAAKGRVLAEPVVALAPSPPFDNAAMDGYAVDTRTLVGPGPWRLEVRDRILAGMKGDRTLKAGEAARIFTGAPVPPGADAVVMQEDIDRTGSGILLCRRPRPGMHVRRTGEDLARGAKVLPVGRRLDAPALAAAAAAGLATVAVRRRVRVALLTGGDEVRQPGQELAPGEIWDVNSFMLSAAVETPAAQLVEVAHVGDDPADLEHLLGRVSRSADLVITVGGISVGSADRVKPTIAKLAGPPVFSGVAIKPGKPVSFGRIGSAFWLGLPGNPVSAFITWELFGRWLVAHLAGEAQPGRPRSHVVTASPLRHRPGRCELRPARIVGQDGTGRDIADCSQETRSAVVSALAEAHGAVLIHSDVESVAEGSLLEFVPFISE
ncbi:molybdopterin molybdotransferase MoeA [Tranquillimonas alkanivorans]|uniref:Molybdopterin molybdenumtransferase n=1 Tax=Tranquillimonas alkanivorans TaxID=441119 RepID=A0A1I5W4Y9_9RHOB|nr:gephyrin-like molybdotransferase Glp [Tranquillimonas alkanivorans]SFQ14733.1 molybdopterin molybdochelatase [Tranquillimonas alkanivorans]